jgi:hypothetical protein
MSRPQIVSNSVWVTSTAFLQLFTGLQVRKIDETTGRYAGANKMIPVDVNMDTKERIYYQLKMGGYKKMEQADTRLPRLGIQIQAINPALDRYTGKMRQRKLLLNTTTGPDDQPIVTESYFDIQPVPYDFTFLVSVWTQHLEYWNQVMENILPWFDPYVLVGVKERNLGIEREIKVSLESVSPNFSFQMAGPQDKRIIRGELTFKCESVMYKAQSTGVAPVEKIYIDIIDVYTPINSDTITIKFAPEDGIIV